MHSTTTPCRWRQGSARLRTTWPSCSPRWTRPPCRCSVTSSRSNCRSCLPSFRSRAGEKGAPRGLGSPRGTCSTGRPGCTMRALIARSPTPRRACGRTSAKVRRRCGTARSARRRRSWPRPIVILRWAPSASSEAFTGCRTRCSTATSSGGSGPPFWPPPTGGASTSPWPRHRATRSCIVRRNLPGTFAVTSSCRRRLLAKLQALQCPGPASSYRGTSGARCQSRCRT
mmetsp:Transcript_67896/g.196535  ORF Transcript_67896/g.196535 Transcript_67896/m.196535 type:complete len:228 (+) Transcript_67896:138-821(+)